MPSTASLPLFHLYGDPPDDQAFDFIHIETIASRSSVHDWTIRAHRHRNLFQILLIEQGGGEMTYEASIAPFAAPTVIVVSPTVAHARVTMLKNSLAGESALPNRAVHGFEVVDLPWIRSSDGDCAPSPSHTTGRAVFRIRRLKPAL